MPETAFIITVDTEGDNLWAKPREITTRNADYLPRFQSLCERHRFKPVYLTNHEMAQCEAYVEFALDAEARDACEIGMHLHAWNSPPLEPLTEDDFRHQPYLTEYPEPLMREKIKRLTALLEDRFDLSITSHRAGRFAFDGRYAAILLDEGYRVDCSVTPGIDWSATPGAPQGSGGTDYSGFPERPYFFSPANIAAPDGGALLEVPVTIRPSGLYRLAPWVYRVPLLRSAANRISPGLSWLSPAENGLDAMRQAARAARAENPAHLELMLHSSELMPGGSPSFRTESDVDRLYQDLEILFEELAPWCRGMTLKELDARMRNEGCRDDTH